MKHILLLLAFGAGCCLPVQAGINTLLRRFLGEPMQAALVSFAVGTVALWLYSLAARHTWPSLSQLAVPWWMWTGGVLGAIFVSCTIFLAPRLGAATMTAVMLWPAGGLGAARPLCPCGFSRTPCFALRLAGIGLLFAGVACAGILALALQRYGILRCAAVRATLPANCRFTRNTPCKEPL